MPFAELLRTTVFLTAGGATALGAIAVIGVADAENTTILLVGAAWWVVAAWIGLSLGSAERSADDSSAVSSTSRAMRPCSARRSRTSKYAKHPPHSSAVNTDVQAV